MLRSGNPLGCPCGGILRGVRRAHEEVELLSDITQVEVIAVGRQIRELPRLRREYGAGRSRKCKGVARVRLPDGAIVTAELHCYEAHGLGRQDTKVKRVLRG